MLAFAGGSAQSAQHTCRKLTSGTSNKMMGSTAAHTMVQPLLWQIGRSTAPAALREHAPHQQATCSCGEPVIAGCSSHVALIECCGPHILRWHRIQQPACRNTLYAYRYEKWGRFGLVISFHEGMFQKYSELFAKSRRRVSPHEHPLMCDMLDKTRTVATPGELWYNNRACR